MSNTALTKVFEESKQGGSAMLIMLAIADSINRETRSTFLSLDYLAEKARVGRRTLLDHLPALEASGELTIDHGAGPRGCNVYSLGPFYAWGANSAPPPSTAHETETADATSGGGADGAPVRSSYADSHPYLLVPSLDSGTGGPEVIEGMGADGAPPSALPSEQDRANDALWQGVVAQVFAETKGRKRREEVESAKLLTVGTEIAVALCRTAHEAALLQDRLATTAGRVLSARLGRTIKVEFVGPD